MVPGTTGCPLASAFLAAISLWASSRLLRNFLADPALDALYVQLTTGDQPAAPAGENTDIVNPDAHHPWFSRSPVWPHPPEACRAFLKDPNAHPPLLRCRIQAVLFLTGDQPAAPAGENTDIVIPDVPIKKNILIKEGIQLGQKPVSKEEAIQAAGELLEKLGYVDAGSARKFPIVISCA